MTQIWTNLYQKTSYFVSAFNKLYKFYEIPTSVPQNITQIQHIAVIFSLFSVFNAFQIYRLIYDLTYLINAMSNSLLTRILSARCVNSPAMANLYGVFPLLFFIFNACLPPGKVNKVIHNCSKPYFAAK